MELETELQKKKEAVEKNNQGISSKGGRLPVSHYGGDELFCAPRWKTLKTNSYG